MKIVKDFTLSWIQWIHWKVQIGKTEMMCVKNFLFNTYCSDIKEELSLLATSLQKHFEMIFHENILKLVSYTLHSYSHRSIISQRVNHSELLSPTHNSAQNWPLKSCRNCWRYCGCNPLIYFDPGPKTTPSNTPLFAFRVLHMLIACSSTAFMNKCGWYF